MPTEWDTAELVQTVTKLAAVNERRANLIEYRDRQILAALNAGATWVQIMNITGLSPRGLSQALKRVRAPR